MKLCACVCVYVCVCVNGKYGGFGSACAYAQSDLGLSRLPKRTNTFTVFLNKLLIYSFKTKSKSGLSH